MTFQRDGKATPIVCGGGQMGFCPPALAYAVALVFIFVCARSSAQTDSNIADAIRRAEGKTSGIYRYGIRSAPNELHARSICLATIRANRARWKKAGKPGDFIDFLAGRYCPAAADRAGNRNWKRNVKWFLRQK